MCLFAFYKLSKDASLETSEGSMYEDNMNEGNMNEGNVYVWMKKIFVHDISVIYNNFKFKTHQIEYSDE